MDDVTLFGNDGDYLILEGQDGQKYRLLSDDSLKSAIKRDAPKNLDAVTLTPREIQDHIRNGMSIEDITSSSGASFSFVEKFAAPVLDELTHMVDSAKSVRITTSQDRYSDSTHVEFGELVETRLGHSGATAFVWMAKRGDFNSWNVSVHFQIGGAASVAAWSFDPRKLTLSPENDSAVSLSTNDPLSTTPIPKLRPVLQVEPEASSGFATEELQASIDVSNETSGAKVAPASWITQLVPTNSEEKGASIQEVPQPEGQLSATADLLQALRIKRGEREAAVESAAKTFEIPADIKSNPDSETSPQTKDLDPAAEVETHSPTVSKKGRAAMPSWDQIVFGTKTEE